MNTPSWARPGVKVVCVDDVRKNGTNEKMTGLFSGRVYTISDVVFWEKWTNRDADYGLHLKELRRNPYKGVVYPFFIGRFRPLITRTQGQDVALFVHHLTGVEENV